MSSERGARNIRRFNDKRAEQNTDLVQAALSQCRARKIRFESFGPLSVHISRSTGIHRTTLSRNIHYRSELLKYLAAQKIPKSNSSNRGASGQEFDANLLAKELEAANLRNEVQRLKKYIERGGPLPQAAPSPGGNQSDRNYQRFVDTAMTLHAVLTRFREIVVLDISNGKIEDLAAPPSRRTIVGPKRLAAFIAWLEQQTKSSEIDAFE